jgi:multidrug efflux system outer membrane protein
LNPRSVAPRLLVLGAALFASACTVHHVDPTPEPQLGAPLPERFSREEGEGAAAADARWWLAFQTPAIDSLVDAALEGSLDVRRAFARVSQAEALAKTAASGQLPQVNATAQVGGARNVFNLGSLGLRSIEAANYQLGVNASYEVDLWGRVSSAKKAAELDVAASREDLDTLRIAVASRVVETSLGAAGEKELLSLLDAQEQSTAKLVELVELRFSQGLASAIDVYQQRQQLAALRAQKPLATARRAVFENQLAVLLGRPPGTLEVTPPDVLPPVPPMPAAGIPSEVLARRPDVRAAMKRIVAADHRVASAIAAQYPTLSLSASTGFQSPDLAILFESWVWNLLSGIVAPIFDGGRRAAEADRARAAVEDAVHAYSQVVLTALGEVEDALAQTARQADHVTLVEEQLAIARLAYEEAEVRYLNGLSSYLEVLTALRAVQQAEQTHLQARRQLLSLRVQLHRALGGGWDA